VVVKSGGEKGGWGGGGGDGGWQGGTVQGVAKMNILKEENILCAQKI